MQPEDVSYEDSPGELLTRVLADLAREFGAPVDEVRRTVERALRAAFVQERSANDLRASLQHLLTPSLDELDPVPHAVVEQVRRLSTLKARLLQNDALTYQDLARAWDKTVPAVRQAVSRARRANRLFTVLHEGETFVPRFLFDETLEPRPETQKAIALLRAAGEDGWALWTWFATPSSWLDGRIPSEVLDEDPDAVAAAAEQRASNVA